MFSARSVFNTQPAAAAGGGGSVYLTNINTTGAMGAAAALVNTPPNSLIDIWATTGYTLEYWLYVPDWSLVTTNPFWGIGNLTNTSFQYWSLGVKQFSSVLGDITIYSYPNFGQPNIGYNNLQPNTWINICMTVTYVAVNSYVIKLYVNGTSVYQNNWNAAPDQYSNATPFFIGPRQGGESAIYVDEVRVSNLVRYASNYTVASSPFTSDANTLFLCHFNGTNGQTTFTDEGINALTISQCNTGNPAVINTSISKF